jgi:DNA-binding response OmpR family regulator
VIRVLIADDDLDIRELVVFKLEQNGIDVIEHGDGESALQSALTEPPDVILLDVMMPRLSGIDVCRRLREDGRTATTPIIMLTAKGQEADVQRGFGAGADDYIVKPFSPRELVSRVMAVSARSRA